MSDKTKIQWTDATFNPWIGCTKVSPGCKNCYAENTTRARVLRSHGQETWGRGARRSRTSEAAWRKPLAWNETPWHCPNGTVPMKGAPGGHGPYVKGGKCPECGAVLSPMRVFPSLCDWLDPEVPIEWLADFLNLIADTPNLDWLLLTKRPENCSERVNAVTRCSHYKADGRLWTLGGLVPHNVWIGASVENQAMADKRIPELLKIPAAVRFLSVEPMLEAVDFVLWLKAKFGKLDSNFKEVDIPSQKIHWVIFGGESGPNARPCNVEWIRNGVRQCKAAGVPAFVKQLGTNPKMDVEVHCDSPALAGLRGVELRPLKLRDKKGGDISEWPEDLRVREMPKEHQ